MTRFEICLPRILEHEGGWSDHPSDPGGATMKGVTLETYSNWLGRKATKDELRNIPSSHLNAIYRDNYWKTAACDKLPAGLDYVVFDLAVNSGPMKAKRMLQQSVKADADGIIGPATLAAIRTMGTAEAIRKLCASREAFYRSLKTFPTFGKGWLNRLHEVEVIALGEA